MKEKEVKKGSRQYKEFEQRMRELRTTQGDDDVEAYNVEFEKALREGMKKIPKTEDLDRSE